MNTPPRAFQDHYASAYSHCYGCGYGNAHGHHLKSYWDGEQTVARYTPPQIYSGGYPGNVYGGLIASLLDCHGAASAFAAACRAQGRALDAQPPMRFVTAQLNIRFLRPAPLGVELELRGSNMRVQGRKVWVDLALHANAELCADAHMLAVQLREEP